MRKVPTRPIQSPWQVSPFLLSHSVRVLAFLSALNFRSLSCPNLAVVTQGDDVVEAPSSGLLGLAWQSIAQTGGTPLFQNLAQSGDLTTPEFAFYFERYQDDPSASADEASGGELTIG